MDSNPGLLIRRLLRACQRPGQMLADLPGWLSLARVAFRYCSALYGQNQTISAWAKPSPMQLPCSSQVGPRCPPHRPD
jgi:hypothetical protein